MHSKIMVFLALAIVCAMVACTKHEVKVEPIKTESVVEVKPMEVTINVNVNVRVDKALDDFFGDIDAAKNKTQ